MQACGPWLVGQALQELLSCAACILARACCSMGESAQALSELCSHDQSKLADLAELESNRDAASGRPDLLAIRSDAPLTAVFGSDIGAGVSSDLSPALSSEA